MPTVLRVEGFRFFFFSNEGSEAPHIHVEHGDGTAKCWLDPVEMAYSRGLKSPQMRRARELVQENQELFLENWHDYFSA